MFYVPVNQSIRKTEIELPYIVFKHEKTCTIGEFTLEFAPKLRYFWAIKIQLYSVTLYVDIAERKIDLKHVLKCNT